MTRNIFLAPLLALLMLAACRSSGPVDFPPLSFARYQPIHMAVANIEIVQEYQPPNHLPNVEHLMPYSPAEAMEIWTRDRLRAVGGGKNLTIIVKNGSVIEYELPKTTGLQGLITVDQEKRYDAKLEIEMRVYGDRALSEASIEVHATQSMTIAENASASQRSAAYRRLISNLMERINAEIEQNLYAHMGNYISYSQNP